jgi:hypothetical protein
MLPHAPDATLIDELPNAAANFAEAPAPVKAGLYATFDVQALYRQHIKQATILATITDTPRCCRRPTQRPPHRQRHIWNPATCRYGVHSHPLFAAVRPKCR